MNALPDDALVARIVEELGLQPHPEGGFFAETYRSDEQVENIERYAGPRALSTAIYFLLTAWSPSRLHRVKSDEIWHFYAGDPLEMLQLHDDGSAEQIVIGSDVAHGQRPQVLVPRGSWQGVRVMPGGNYGLVGATVAPGFDFADFEMGERESLAHAYPMHAALIEVLS
ncbi:MAG: cupin domain-containing protein [bacterium]|nr:cupin domain-containing protein [bacterium]